MSSLPPPKSGSLRQAAQVCVQRLQAAPALQELSQSERKRPLPTSPRDPSPSNLPPLSQRIRRDIQIEESEIESPEREVLRSFSYSENSPAPASPCLRDVPSPASLVFTPAQCVNCESGLEKLEEGPVQEGAFEEGAVVEEGALEEGVVVGKSDQEDEPPDVAFKVSEFRRRWSERLEDPFLTDDSALKSRILESLVDAYRTPLSVLPDRDFKAVKDEFLDGDLDPVQFLEKLQSLPRCSE